MINFFSGFLNPSWIKPETIQVSETTKKVFLAFYPWQSLLVCTHAEMHVDGQARFGPEIRGIKGVSNLTGEYDKGKPYLAIEILVSNNELQALEQDMKKEIEVNGTCSQATNAYLARGIKENLVPFPVCISPLASTIYLLAKKLFGSKRLGDIEVRAKGKAFWRLFSIGMLVEGVQIALVGFCATLGMSRVYSNLRHYR